MARFIASLRQRASPPLRRRSVKLSSEHDTARLRAVGMAASRRAANAAGPVARSATDRTRLSDRFLEFLGGAEGDLLAGLDLDGFAGGRIAAHARGALAYLQDA